MALVSAAITVLWYFLTVFDISSISHTIVPDSKLFIQFFTFLSAVSVLIYIFRKSLLCLMHFICPLLLRGRKMLSIDSGLGRFSESQRHMLKLQHKMYSIKQSEISGKWLQHKLFMNPYRIQCCINQKGEKSLYQAVYNLNNTIFPAPDKINTEIGRLCHKIFN